MWFKGNHIRNIAAPWLGHIQIQILSSKCKNALELFESK